MNVTKRFASLWPELQAFAIPILIFELLRQLNKMKCIWLGVLYYTGYPDCVHCKDFDKSSFRTKHSAVGNVILLFIPHISLW